VSIETSKAFTELMLRAGESAPEPRLSATRRALALLDNPHERSSFIHVTGTNGKTSTIRMTATLREGSTVLACQAFADGRIAVFLQIALDHQRQLGSTIEQIARTKSGIIKPGTTVVTSAQSPEALEAIVAKAGTVGAPVLALGSAFDGRTIERTESGQRVTLTRIDGSVVSDAVLNLHGDYQAANAAVALAAVDAFLDDKDASDVIEALAPFAAAFLVTRSSSPRSVEISRLAEVVAQRAPTVPVFQLDVPLAVVAAAALWAIVRAGTAVVGSANCGGRRFTPTSSRYRAKAV
jgi:folylpolyglutamate synthase/dihydropteroate synthase